MTRQYVHRINEGGNFCGHNPLKPRFVLAKPAKKGKGGRPAVITRAMERLQQFYHRPTIIPSLNLANGSDRQMRSERREACVVVLAAILKNTDVASLRVGFPTKDGFVNRSIQFLVEETGLPIWRIDRALKDLKASRLITVSQKRLLNPDGTWKGLPAVKAVSKHLFGVFGMTVELEFQRKRKTKELKKQAAEWRSGEGEQRKLSDISKQYLVVAGLKTNPKQKPRRRPIQPLPPAKRRTEAEVSKSIEDRMARMLREAAERKAAKASNE